MHRNYTTMILLVLPLLFISPYTDAELYHEISGSPFATNDAPLPQHIKSHDEKVIMVNPSEHTWGAYDARGKLIRWGIATAGSDRCEDSNLSCRTTTGSFRIHSLGNGNCISHKYNGAAMPYCMYFNGSQALHGSDDVQFQNVSHGCVRIHVDDAKWLRYHYVEGPNPNNQFQGTKIIIQSY